MKQQSGKPREVAPTELKHGLGRLRLCTPEEQQEMERSLQRLGQLQAVLVYRDAEGWEVIDGFKRVRAACALEWAGIRVEELDVDAAGAKVRLWQSNAGRGMTEGASGFRVGPKLPLDTSRVEIQAAQMEVDGVLVALAIAESVGSAF